MKLPPREITNKIRFIVDEWIPPIIRDAKWVMLLPLKIVLGHKTNAFINFKDTALELSEEEFTNIYEAFNADKGRQTHLNKTCIKEILRSIVGKTVLEVGSGNGYLASKMSEKYQVTASDIVIDKKAQDAYPNVRFKKANVEKLPFKNKSFDTVVCAHTLEHVQNIHLAILELRRVKKKRLIIVVPKQRPYRYTFDFHVHFFPYIFSFMAIMKDKKNHKSYCKEIDGDLFYKEDA